MKKLFFLIAIMLSTLSQVNAQLPDFMKRLDGGSIEKTEFYEKIPFKLNNNRIYIEALINNRNFRFLIDTHSPCLLYNYVVDEASLDTINKSSLLGKSFEKSFLLPIFPKIDSFSIGNVIFKDIGAMQMKNDSSNPLNDYPLDGILGSNLMKQCIWQFNFIDSTLSITNDISKCEYINDSFQLKFSPKQVQGSPNIIATINNIDTLNVQFDTGNSGFVNGLSPIIEKKIKNGKAVKWTMKLNIPIGKKKSDSIESHYYVRIDSLKLGESDFYNLPIVAYNPNYKQTMGKGSIGIDFLKHFVTTIDWIENKIYLYPFENKNFFLHNKKTFGFTYKYSNNKFLVNSIFQGSEAEKSGLEIGDEIISINGIDLTQLTKESIKNFNEGKLKFSDDLNSDITIKLLKKGRVKKFKLKNYSLFQENNLE